MVNLLSRANFRKHPEKHPLETVPKEPQLGSILRKMTYVCSSCITRLVVTTTNKGLWVLTQLGLSIEKCEIGSLTVLSNEQKILCEIIFN